MEWIEGNRIKIDPPKKFKKITGTRFGAVLGENVWTTPFSIWCAVTKTYEKPFEDTIYTAAGKAIEPKQAAYMKNSYGMNIISPTDIYGEDYFSKTFGDFFPEEKCLGGMWDYLATDEDGKVDTVLEMKTTKRSEDWEKDIPEYYALQAALYAYLLKVDNVIMVASFLEDSDYQNPEAFTPNVNNTITRVFKVSERYPDFDKKVEAVLRWWRDYVEGGISPEYDEVKDADILKALRTKCIDTSDTDIKDVIKETEKLKQEIDAIFASIKDKTDRLEVLQKAIKDFGKQSFGEGDKKVEFKGDIYNFSISKSIPKPKAVYDEEAMKNDKVYDKYVSMVVGEPTYRLNINTI